MSVTANKTDKITTFSDGIINAINCDSISSCGLIKRKNCVSFKGEELLRNFSLEELSNNVHLLEVELDVATKSVTGLGMKNIHGGVSFYSKGMKKPVTVGEKMYSKFSYMKTSQSLSLCVFMYFTDYLAFLKQQEKVREFRRISCPDILIINDIENYISALIEGDTYHDIYFFLPNNETSRIMTLTALDYNKRVVDYSELYQEYEFLFETLNDESAFHKQNRCINCCACCGIGQNHCNYLSITIEDLNNPPCEQLGGYPFGNFSSIGKCDD